MILRVYKRGADIVVAACDKETLGKSFSSSDFKLYVSPSFYGKEEVEEDDLISALKRCTTANLVGKKTVGAAVRLGFVEEACVIKIGGVPHAQLFKIAGSEE